MVLEDKKKVAEEHSWYHHEYIACLLFTEHDLEWVQLLIGGPTLFESVKLRPLQ